jgi:putative ABC transport system permease protein
MDFKFALRMLVKDPWFTFVAVLALALGIGVNNTVFTFVNAVLVRGLPFENGHEIMHLNARNTVEGNDMAVSLPDYRDWRAQTKTFASLAAYQTMTMNVSDAGHPPERTNGVRVTANAFGILGERPVIGRDFQPGEDRAGAQPVVILGYGLWKSRYGKDPAVIGRTIRVNEVANVIIGVMPEGNRFPNNADMWQALVPDPDQERREARRVDLFGRLAPGATLKQAQTEMSGIAKRLEQQYPDSNKAVDARVMTFNDRFNGGPIRAVFLALMGAVGFVLLIACANVANLLLARSAHRSREMAVRIALGASRARIIRQLLVESVLLSFLGGILGLALSLVGVRLFDRAVADVGKPYWIHFTMDTTVFAFLVAVCFATGIIFGLAPALHVSKTNLNDILKEGGRGTSGGRRARWMTASMVVAELALTLVLLVGAGLMIRSFFKLYSLDTGVDTSRLVTMRLRLADKKYPKPEQRQLFYDALLPRLQAVPGIATASITSAPPVAGADSRPLEIEGRAPSAGTKPPQVSVLYVSETYFDALGVTLRQGRPLRQSDGTPGSEGAVVNARFVSQFFEGQDAVGKRIRVGTGERVGTNGPWMPIVGISPAVRQRNAQDIQPDAVVYVSYRLTPPAGTTILARTQGDPSSVVSSVRQAVQEIDPNQPVFDVQTMDQFLAQNRWPYRVFGTMFTLFAIIALVLSAVGIYAVTAYSVTQRTQEIGLRMALGAQPAQVSWLILRQGLIQLVVGLSLGLAAAIGISPVLQALLVQITPSDPLTLGVICVLLTTITVAACLIPARRATHLDPLSALRVE